MRSLAAVGERLRLERDVEILIVGGAAGVVTGELPESWTTADVDVLHCHLPEDREAVLNAAAEVTRELDLPPAWMSDFGGLYAWTLPAVWEDRRVHVGSFGRLRVYAIARQDLIAMKFLAHRTRDLEHLEQLRLTGDDFTYVESVFDALEQSHAWERATIEKARTIARDFRREQEHHDDHGQEEEGEVEEEGAS